MLFRSGFGSKGQKARSGVKHAGFEGGQMPLARRLPKVGFNNIFATQYAIVNVADLEAAFNAGDVVDTEALKAKGLVKKTLDGVKVLGNGELTKALTVKAMDNRLIFLYCSITELWGHVSRAGAGNGKSGTSEVPVR